jgi:superfamily II RNA helicase
MSYVEVHTGIYNKPDLLETYINFEYELADFQKFACYAINCGDNVLVTSHTGSGKTTCAIMAIARALKNNKIAVYTSPIKSLSNQIFHDLNNLFPNQVGIITGDVKISPSAPIMVVTAEILRNVLLKENNEYNEWNLNINLVGCIILDEVHSINLEQRGKIWEEILIHNLDTQIIMLSATISESEKFAEWIGKLKKVKCHLISTQKRPVPLQHAIWFNNELNYFLHGDKDWKKGIWTDISVKINKYYKTNPFSLNEFFNCVKYLFNNNMTPANFFLLNRELCYKYAEKIPIIMTTPEEAIEIQNIWKNRLHKYKLLYESSDEWHNLYKLVQKGIGYHHSGMIPILKEIVEILYGKNLIKILITTETFAVGVNFPTKTVVFCAITKFDTHKRILMPSEYTQMAGRAGRKNKDIIGNVIILPSKNFIDEDQAKKMILSPPQKLSSKFSIDIIFILKHLDSECNSNNIYEICYNSLFHYQEYNEDNYNITLKKLSEINISDDSINIYNKIKNINDQITTFKLNPKQFKKLNSEKEELSKNINISLIETYIKLKKEVDNLELLKNKVKINNQIDIIIDYLKNNNYINEDLKLTKHGKILSEINECNPFILSYIIFNNLFDELDFPEIVAICSILINDSGNASKSNDEIFINDLDCSNTCKQLLNSINNEIDKFYKLEDNLNKILQYPTWLEWTTYYGLFDNVKSWASGSCGNEFINGNFIKTILRLNNLLRNVEIIAKLYDNIKLLNKIYGFQEKLIRDTVISDSLYLC